MASEAFRPIPSQLARNAICAADRWINTMLRDGLSEFEGVESKCRRVHINQSNLNCSMPALMSFMKLAAPTPLATR